MMVFEVLQWLLFLSSCPPVPQLFDGWCVTAKAPPDISVISAFSLPCKHVATAVHLHRFSNLVPHQKIIDMAMNGVGCQATAPHYGRWPQHGATSLKTPGRSPKTLAHTQPGSDVIVCAEMDEQWP